MIPAGRSAGRRPRVRVSGPVRRLRAGGPSGLPMLRADLGGGPGKITVIWLGRTHIAGIEPGRVLTVEGRLSERAGHAVMYNPRYDLGAGPQP